MLSEAFFCSFRYVERGRSWTTIFAFIIKEADIPLAPTCLYALSLLTSEWKKINILAFDLKHPTGLNGLFFILVEKYMTDNLASFFSQLIY